MPKGERVHGHGFGPAETVPPAGGRKKDNGHQNRADQIDVSERIERDPAVLLGGMIALEFGYPSVSIFMNAQPQKYGKNACYCSLD